MVRGLLTRRRALVLAGLLAVTFGALARALPEQGGMALDLIVSDWLGSRATDGGSIVATWISWLGDTALSGLTVAAIGILFHRRRWRAALVVGGATLGAMALNIQLKLLFHRGRPDYAIEFITGPTWSFPSGHAMSSIVGYGILAYFRVEHERHVVRRRLILFSACFMVLAVGVSRLYLGVHYLSDVLGGFLAGGVWLLMCLEVYRTMKARQTARPEHPDRAVPRTTGGGT